MKAIIGGAEAGKEQGFGLGLAAVKRIIEVLGGALWVESQPGHGGIFILRYPRGRARRRRGSQLYLGRARLRGGMETGEPRLATVMPLLAEEILNNYNFICSL